ncbi:serine/threonine protein kinase [Methylovirgula sp. 4M-Z18]|uniref:serine/threonine protein kinase n=1 Tax=Methylovirgula sp. 4M-Z18 TaxID=2293567 RepID=UPI001FDF23A2|nr:serine/threonine protein kinase [Methylovirgula sp. 4M-Z18]
MTDDRTRIAVRGSAVSIGTELNQTYRIDSLLGAGGMGEVFKGHNIQTGDPVAIKIVLPEFAQNETILALFRKEARILNHLNHEAIVRYYVFSIDPALSRPYLAMEYVDGPSLAAHVKTAPLAPSEFMPLLRRLADGLHRAHQAGIIHRDMSPDNVILPGGLVQNAKIIDFGIARSANVGGETLLGGSFAGKYNFVSPEQLGLYGGEVTPKSDLYSLALVMVAAARGQPLDMSGSQLDVIEKRRNVPDLAGIPKQFHPVLSAMLMPDPAQRPADMAAIRDWPDPQPALKAKPEKPRAAASNLVRAEAPKPSNALRYGIFAAAAVAAIGIGAWGGWFYVQTSTSPQKGGGASETAGQNLPPGDNKVTNTEPAIPIPPDGKSLNVSPPSPVAGDDKLASAEATTRLPPNGQSSDVSKPSPPEGGDTVAKAPSPTSASTTVPTSTDNKPLPGPDSSASLETSSTRPTAPLSQQSTTASLDDFVTNFGANNCFAAKVDRIAASSATITALGTSKANQTFIEAFKQRAGFTPAVTLDPVSASQCGFVDALPHMSVPGAPPLHITLSAPEIHGSNPDTGTLGDPLNVSITGGGERNIYLFVMDHNGGIQNINRLCPSCTTMKAGELDAALSLSAPARVDGESRPPFYPMLVFAVASSRPLISINAQDAFEADDFIAPFLKEIANTKDVTTAVGFLKLHDPLATPR